MTLRSRRRKALKSRLQKGSLSLLVVLLLAPQANAFWLLNFQTAATLPPGGLGFIGGTGGQITSVGSPRETSFTPFLAHAGVRVGLADGLDVGYRLCTLPLPYSSAGPTLGAETDLKARLTPKSWRWQAALIAGMGFAYLDLAGQSRDAWAPGGDLLVTHALTKTSAISLNARYVYTGIPTAAGGAASNHVQALGGSVGLWFSMTPTVSLLPELGLFDFQGSLAGSPVNGWGLQYGAVFAARIW